MILYFGSPDCRSPLFQKAREARSGTHSQRGHRHICDTQRETAKYAKKSKGQQGEACAQEAARHDPLAVRNSERWVYGPSGCGGLEHRLAKFHQRICQTGECGPLSDEGRGAAAERWATGTPVARVGLVCWAFAHRESVVSGMRPAYGGLRPCQAVL